MKDNSVLMDSSLALEGKSLMIRTQELDGLNQISSMDSEEEYLEAATMKKEYLQMIR